MIYSQAKIQEIKNRFEIVGNSPMLNEAIEKALRVAPTDISVLITGESGVGKEAFSKIIHHQSMRKHGNFIAINAAAIPEGTIDSELFGHEKGAFTNAYDSRKGYFETVNGGTIFLDEISELPLETQSRLLRVLETGEFIKVGSSKVLKTDIRLVAASNKDLLDLSNRNKFREDLYYRLSTVTIRIPALRKRTEDVLFLVAKFSNDFADKYKTPPIEFTPDAIDLLKMQEWPGNIRQLKNVVEQISILETERTITKEILKVYLPEMPGKQLIKIESRPDTPPEINERDILYRFLIDIKKDLAEAKNMIGELVLALNTKGDDIQGSLELVTDRLLKSGTETPIQLVRQGNLYTGKPVQDGEEAYFTDVTDSLSLTEKEKQLIKEALIKHRGRRKPAAKELGISERTLYRKIKEYDLEDL